MIVQGGRENRPTREDEHVTYKCFPSVDSGRTRAVEGKTCICVYYAQVSGGLSLCIREPEVLMLGAAAR